MVKKIIVIADTKKLEVIESINQIRPWLENLVDIQGWYNELEDLKNLDFQGIDFVLTFGGDGLLISAARLIAGMNIPLIGVNFGKLGFLTDLTMESLVEKIPEILKGDYKIKKRIMLRCQVLRDGKVIHEDNAINDAIVKSTAISRSLYTKIFINEEEIANYGGDGVIVATPVGSTAYSLSAGGPVVHPRISSLVITPICPHILTLRPFIIPSDKIIKIHFYPPYPGEIILSIDGQINFPLEKNDSILLSKAPQSFSLLMTKNRSFFKVLREKLVWGEVRLKEYNEIQ